MCSLFVLEISHTHTAFHDGYGTHTQPSTVATSRKRNWLLPVCVNVCSCVNPCVHMKVCSYVNPHVRMFLCACVDVCICMCKSKVHVGCPPQLFSAFCIFISFITCECICVGMRVSRNTCYSEHEEVRGPSVEISSLHLPHGSQARTRVMELRSRHT